MTAASVNWSIDPWAAGGSYGVDVTSVVSEVVARPGWTSGNAIALQLTPVITGWVEPWSYDGSVTRTAQLALTYTWPVAAPATTTLEYRYDPLQRLTGATATGDHAGWWVFAYDAQGNVRHEATRTDE